jgi:hypothetical protein
MTRLSISSSEDFGIRYRTSCKFTKDNFDDFIWTILAEFSDKSHAYDFEQFCIFENWGNRLQINKSCYHNKLHFSHSTPHTAETRFMMKMKRDLYWTNTTDEFRRKHGNNKSKALLSRSPEAKELTKAKTKLTKSLKTQEEKDIIEEKRQLTNSLKSKEEQNLITLKILASKAARSPEEKLASKLKRELSISNRTCEDNARTQEKTRNTLALKLREI